ncbi:MAG TPA: DNA primase small subunit domain-containing protein [Geobacterales bacterium]|nr:DNA primase small subunit domain-containing protein [Geobacterales bacterium]
MDVSKVLPFFRLYYKNLNPEDLSIPQLDRREFALWDFLSNNMIRHLAFKNSVELKEGLSKRTPRHVYYSVSTYEYPFLPDMEMKKMISTNLVFDIDIDHVYTPCKEIHDSWLCRNCGNSGSGFTDSCKFCGSPSLDKLSFVCNECLEVAKSEVLKLIEDFLFADFGIKEDEVKIVFSGNRGYHVHVENEEFSNLDSKARNMMIDYIKGITARHYFLDFLKKQKYKFKGIASSGYPSRLAEKILEELLAANEHDLIKIGISEIKVKDLMAIKEKIIQSLQGYSADYGFLRSIGSKSKEIITKAISDISVEIDERVTVDNHRLIRMPNSIHGKTGLRVTPLGYNDLDNFDPFRDSVVFKEGYARIKIKRKLPSIKFFFGDNEFFLGSLNEAKVPIALALYLTLNEYADIYELL